MKPNRWVAPTSLLALLVACNSPSAPTTDVPDLRGTWRSPGRSWNWSESYTYSPGATATGGCDGELVIDLQSGRSFQGRYAIECTGEPASGRLVDGDIGPDGRLSFRLVPEEGWDPGRGPRAAEWVCSSLDEPPVFEGSLVQSSIDTQRSERLTCPPGLIIVTATFRGERQPSSSVARR